MSVVLKSVYKAFEEIDGKPKYVLNDIRLHIHDGEFVCILGKSGCGKSTLLNLLAGYLKTDAGRISVNGQEIDGPSAQRGVVFQQHALFPWYTVMENIEFGPKLAKRKDSKKIAQELVSLVGLNGYENKYPGSLSGGMAQRVGIARALANDPEVLLMDEPLGALDAMIRQNMRREIIKIWEKTNKTVIFITHSIPEAVYLADRVVLLKEGRVEEDVKIDISRPRDVKSPEFLEYVDFFEKGLSDQEGESLITE
ncbi:MAG: putative transporter ATP-binding protein [Oscillospiraceae bacterium]|jgi:NitT/TauT family transport system ATP-binding protein|nr:putative transporter ATP-binding protein [Oscillospiraceae bacterium]